MTNAATCPQCQEPERVTTRARILRKRRPYVLIRYACDACGHRREEIDYLPASAAVLR